MKLRAITVGTFATALVFGAIVIASSAPVQEPSDAAAFYKSKCVACHGKKAEKKFDTAIADDQLRTRIARLTGSAKRTETAAAKLERRLSEALAQGMESPSVRLDSAGAIYLATTLLPSSP